MAVNEARSMNRDLVLGATDGKFKNLTPDRGGEVDTLDATIRAQELQLQYDLVNRTPMADLPTAAYGRRR